MRAITVQQPWAWAIFRAGKDVENRANRRGQETARKQFAGLAGQRILVHSSSRLAGRDADTEVRRLSPVEVTAPGMPGAHPEWALGSILGTVDVVGVHTADACYDPATGRFCSPWAQPGAAHLQFASPRLLFRAIAYKGALGPWTVTDETVLAKIRREAAG